MPSLRSASPTPARRRATPLLLSLTAGALLLATVPAAAERPHVYALTGATVITAPGQRVDGATIVVRDGLIAAVGTGIGVPADAEVIEAEGMTVWAGFIDAYSHLGLQQRQGGGGGFNFAALLQPPRPEPGISHPIELVHPQHRVVDEIVGGDAEVARRREIGFTAALAVPRDGIFRGWSALIALGDGDARTMVVAPAVAQHVGFDTGGFFSYPSSPMGSIATIRQVMYDAARYVEWTRRYEADPRGMQRPHHDDAMIAIASTARDTTVFFHAGDNRWIERALAIAREAGVETVIVGSGFEYEILDIVAGSDVTYIVPVDYPDEPDVSSPDRLPSVSLESLRRWELADTNPSALERAGVTFALTPYGMGNAGKFAENVRRAIEKGLTPDTALAAVTTIPARLLDVEATMGTVEAGKIANLVVGTGDPFAEGTEIRHVFVDGRHWEMEAAETVGDPDAVVDPRGEWSVVGTVMGTERNSTWFIEGEEGDYSGRSVSEMGDADFESVTLEGNALTVVIPQPGGMGTLEITVVIEGDEFTGSTTVDLPNGQSITIGFRGERTAGPQGGAR